MTCDCVTVDYPSNKLKPLVEAAIQAKKEELIFLSGAQSKKVEYFNNLPWYKRFFAKDPKDCWSAEYWGYLTELECCNNALKILRQTRTAANSSDTVRMTGECLANIDEWAGN